MSELLLYTHLTLQLSLSGMFARLYNFIYPTTVLALGSSVLTSSLVVTRLRGQLAPSS